MRQLLSYHSRIGPVWLWHALFDGSLLCRCEHSRRLSLARKDMLR